MESSYILYRERVIACRRATQDIREGDPKVLRYKRGPESIIQRDVRAKFKSKQRKLIEIVRKSKLSLFWMRLIYPVHKTVTTNSIHRTKWRINKKCHLITDLKQNRHNIKAMKAWCRQWSTSSNSHLQIRMLSNTNVQSQN